MKSIENPTQKKTNEPKTTNKPIEHSEINQEQRTTNNEQRTTNQLKKQKNMQTKLKTAIFASLEAGKRIMEIYTSEDFEVELKADESPLTKADKEAHLIIVKALRDIQIPILSEEGKSIPYEERKEWKQLWIVDPIDGTKEFIKRNGEFTVNIALINEGYPILGVIYVPAKKELYFASEGLGSFKMENIVSSEDFLEKEDFAEKLPLNYEKNKFTVVASKSHLSQETKDYIATLQENHGEIDMISKGSSLKLCMVAEGKADCYPRFAPTMEWDTAAGQAICHYAGKTVIDYNTKTTMRYNRENLLNNWFIVQSK